AGAGGAQRARKGTRQSGAEQRTCQRSRQRPGQGCRSRQEDTGGADGQHRS
ncbi:clpP, partial [Symbiodinium sp. CCMP2456]